jgi:predicted PurR-regulated permease PerM
MVTTRTRSRSAVRWRTGSAANLSGRQLSGIALGLALLAVTWLLLRPLALLLAGGIVACGIDPLVRFCQRRIPRAGAVLLIYSLLLVAFAGVSALAIPVLGDQAQSLLRNGPQLIAQGQEWAQQHGSSSVTSDQVSQILVAAIQKFSSGVISLPLHALSAAAEILVVIVMSIYWLLAAPAMLRFTLSLAPPERRSAIDSLLSEVCQTMGRYVLGMLADVLALAFVVYIGLTIIGVHYALVLALLAGAGVLVPIIGPILSAIPAIAIAFAASPLQALIVLTFYVVLHHVESDLLLPMLMKNQADIPPLLVVFALIVGASTGSILAVLIAIPIAGALRVILLRVVAPSVRGIWEEGTAAGL